MLDFDMAVLNEIHDQIKESQPDGKKSGAAMEARRKQRRSQLSLGDGEMVQFLKDNSFIDEGKEA